MKYNEQEDTLPTATENDLSASYGLNRLKGSNCDLNPYSRLSSRMTWSAVSTASLRSKRIQQSNHKHKQQQGEPREKCLCAVAHLQKIF